MRDYTRVWSSRKWSDRKKSYEKKKYSIFSIEIVIVKMTNRLLFEKVLKIFEMKKCERFIKNCILRQYFNCQKYDHIDKHCKIVVVYDTCANEHRTSDCDFDIIDKHKKCDVCENRKHIAWVSNCKIRMKKKSIWRVVSKWDCTLQTNRRRFAKSTNSLSQNSWNRKRFFMNEKWSSRRKKKSSQI
jgi:hypothetical protein